MEIDPVCGMTVKITDTSRKHDHQGQTYHFCGEKCRTRFIADPYFYLSEQGCTVASLDPAIKNKISHRGQALQQLLQQLTTRGLVNAAGLQR